MRQQVIVKTSRLIVALVVALVVVGRLQYVPAMAEEQVTVQGVVWYDDNQNGAIDPGEELAPRATVRVSVTVGGYGKSWITIEASSTADAAGRFQLSFSRTSGRSPTLLASVLRPGYPYLSGVPHNYYGAARIPLNTIGVITVNVPLRPGYPGVTIRLAPGAPADFPVPNGHFFTQTNGYVGGSAVGFAVTNAGGIPFWDTWQQLGLENVGYPISGRITWNGFTSQVMQKQVFQWRPEVEKVYFVNVFNELSKAGKDDWLLVYRQVPKPFDWSADVGLPWNEIVQRHLKLLDSNPAIKARYLADPDPIAHLGLPMSYGDFGNVFVVRCQRAVLQQWKVDVPWAGVGQVTIANGGDIAKEARLIPQWATVPEPPPAD